MGAAPNETNVLDIVGRTRGAVEPSAVGAQLCGGGGEIILRATA